MKGIEVSEWIDAPAARVFDLMTDMRAWPSVIRAIERIEVLTEGPMGVGTRFRETRRMFGKDATEEMTVTGWEPGRSYTLGCTSCGVELASMVRVMPEGVGSRLSMRTEGRAVSLGAKLMSGVMSWMMSGVMRRCLAQDLADIKKAAEAAP